MSEKKPAPDRSRRKTGADAPHMAKALRQEEAYLEFCDKVRTELKHMREDMGVKQSEVAAALQMSQPAVSNLENGEGDIGLISIFRYAEALGMQPTVSFAPAPSTYARQAHLRKSLRAIEKLAESRLAEANPALQGQFRELAALVSAQTGAGVAAPAVLGALASAISGAMSQSFSSEIASVVSALSDLDGSRTDGTAKK